MAYFNMTPVDQSGGAKQYAWQQFDSSGNFIGFVTSDDENEYSGSEYELVKLGLPIEYTYTGNSNLEYKIELDADNMPHIAWELKLLTSGDLNIKKILTKYTDVFLVGGGGGGGGAVAPQGVSGGGGGGSGYTNTQKDININLNTIYPIIIGVGGTGGSGTTDYSGNTNGDSGSGSSAFNFTAKGGAGGVAGRIDSGNYNYYNGGTGGAGGSGGGGGGAGTRGSNGSAGTGQGSTTRAFAESFNVLYATGGTGGAGYVYVGSTHTKGYQGGVDGADGTTVEADIVVAKANTGNGGPGGGYSSISGGNGGSGIVILRGRYE